MKYKKACILFSVVLIVLLFSQCRRTTGELSPESFLNPPSENRPLALWTWMNGYVDTSKMVFELNEMKDKGMRGALIWDIGSLADPGKIIPEGPAFLGPESLEYMSLALKTSGELGLDLGMVASSSWNAGGEWVRMEDASMQLLCTSQILEGPVRAKIKIEIPKTQRGEVEIYSLLTSLALPYAGSRVIDNSGNQAVVLDALTSEDRVIEWEVPEGKWEVFSFFMCNTGQNLVCPSPNSNGLVIDHLSKQATQRHFDSILARLDRVSTPENHMKFMMLDSYEVWEMKDWTPLLMKEFISRYGYDPKPFLPLLLGYEPKRTASLQNGSGVITVAW